MGDWMVLASVMKWRSCGGVLSVSCIGVAVLWDEVSLGSRDDSI